MSNLTCCDCYWRISGGIFDDCCEKHGRKKVAYDHPICSDFLSDDTPSCSDCMYHEYTTFGGKCTLHNKKIKETVMAPPACYGFVED